MFLYGLYLKLCSIVGNSIVYYAAVIGLYREESIKLEG